MAGKQMWICWQSKYDVRLFCCFLALLSRTNNTYILYFCSPTSLTVKQQMPIKGESVVDLNLGSSFAAKLGFAEIDEWDDANTATTVSESSVDDTAEAAQPTDGGGESGGSGKKKKKNKKKKKK
jgi:hypothetical protein